MKNRELITERKQLMKIAGLLKEAEEVTPEEAAEKAVSYVGALEQSPEIQKVASEIADDPKATKQLMDLLSKYSVSLNEDANLDTSSIKNIALAMAKKADTLQEDDNYGGALLGGLVAGGTLAHYLFSVTTADFVGGLTHSTAALPETLIGAVIGAALAVIGKLVYDKSQGND